MVSTLVALHLLRGVNGVGVRGTDDPATAVAWLREHFTEWAGDLGLNPLHPTAWDDPNIVEQREAFLASLTTDDHRPYGPWCQKGWLRWNPQASDAEFAVIMGTGREGQRGSFLGCMWWLG